jgi:hypothetical protein
MSRGRRAAGEQLDAADGIPNHPPVTRLGSAYLSTTCLELSVKKGDYRSDDVVTNPGNLLRWWPMVTDHPFSSSSILPPGGTENPRVGGSIPSQATKPT